MLLLYSHFELGLVFFLLTLKDSFSTIAENLQLNLEQVKIEINDLKNTCIYQIEPEIKKSESFISKINNLHKQIDNINTELDEQVRVFYFCQIKASIFSSIKFKIKRKICLKMCPKSKNIRT